MPPSQRALQIYIRIILFDLTNERCECEYTFSKRKILIRSDKAARESL